MKSFIPAGKLLCLLFYTLFSGINSYSQCGNGTTMAVISYDTVFYGGGTSNYDLNFPQFDTATVLNFPLFDPSKGTLVKVDVETIVSVKFSYTLENLDNTFLISKVKMSRSDIITSPILINPFEETMPNKLMATYTLSPWDGTIGTGPDFVEKGQEYLYKNHAINYNLNSNLAGFLGNGQVVFNYQTETDLFPSGAKYSWNPITQDSVYFRLTYHYCTTNLLAAEIGNFTTTKLSSGNLQLSFDSPNDYAGNQYDMQKSTDGKNYTTFQTIISKSSVANHYQVNYAPTRDDKNKVFFRIKQYEDDGTIKYSIVKTVDLEFTSTAMKVYPTVTKNDLNIYFPYAAKSDYQVSIISVAGQVMQQNVFTRTSAIKVILNSNLKSGMYIVSVVNKQTSEMQQAKLLIK